MTVSDRPLLDIVEAQDRAQAEIAREAQVRRSLIRQRILTAQTAAERLGIRPGSTPWKLIGLIAKIAGWDPLQTTKGELCRDADLDCKESTLKNALARLATTGLLHRDTIYASTYTGKSEAVGVELQLQFKTVTELTDGSPSGGSTARRRQGVNNPVNNPVKNVKRSICISYLPSSLSPPPPEEEFRTTKPSGADRPIEAWEVVVSELENLGVRQARETATAACKSGLPPEKAHAFMKLYRERSHNPYWTDEQRMHPGWLARWLTGQSVPEPDRREPLKLVGRGDGLTREQVARESLRTRIVKEGRSRNCSEEEIAARCAAAGVEYT